MLGTSLQKLAFSFILLGLITLATGCGDDKKERLKPLLVDAISLQKKPNTTKALSTERQQNTAIDKASLLAFEACSITEDLLNAREGLIKNSKPFQSYDGYLTYKIKARFHKLPINKVIFGVCFKDEPLSKDCSFIEDIAFILDVTYDKAVNELKKANGVDFSVEKRSNLNDLGAANGPTLRPFLYKGGDGSTVLHCDTGGL